MAFIGQRVALKQVPISGSKMDLAGVKEPYLAKVTRVLPPKYGGTTHIEAQFREGKFLLADKSLACSTCRKSLPDCECEEPDITY